jgi:hypothetical protein
MTLPRSIASRALKPSIISFITRLSSRYERTHPTPRTPRESSSRDPSRTDAWPGAAPESTAHSPRPACPWKHGHNVRQCILFRFSDKGRLAAAP